MIVIIAEKPSVAREIAKILGATTKASVTGFEEEIKVDTRTITQELLIAGKAMMAAK